MEQLIFLAIAILYGIGVSIYRFVKWANRQISSNATPTPGQQALADAQRQAQGPTPQAPMAQALPERASSLAPPRPIAARPMPRQPQAGGSAVPREATDTDFRRQEQELVAGEPAALGVALRSSTASAPSKSGLFQDTDDLVRAIILREALGPPLSRRSSPK